MPKKTFLIEMLKAGAYLFRQGNRILQPLGLTQQQFVILQTVVERGPLPQKGIRSELLFEKSNVSKGVSHLEKRGLVQTTGSETDKRSVLVQATEKGSIIARECMTALTMWNRAWLGGLTDDELEECTEVLQLLTQRPGVK